MRIAILALLIIASGCTSRAKAGKSAADVWHIGHAMELGQEKLPPETIGLMGKTLKAIAYKWAESLGDTIDKGPNHAVQP
jgi:hypothetical protein